jgi:hypothetical protein
MVTSRTGNTIGLRRAGRRDPVRERMKALQLIAA